MHEYLTVVKLLNKVAFAKFAPELPLLTFSSKQQVVALTNTFATKDGSNFYSSMQQTLVDQKTTFVEHLSKAEPIIDGLLKVFSSLSLSPEAAAALGLASIAKVVFSLYL